MLKNLSNCELVYEDADLSSAHAVVFHLHKVQKFFNKDARRTICKDSF